MKKKNGANLLNKWRGIARKKVFNGRSVVMFLLCFIVLCMVGELAITLINSFVQYNSSYVISLAVVPSFAVCLTAVIIYINNRNNKQMDTITEAFEKVSRGDYNINLEVPRRGRYKVIFQNFNKMAKELSSVQIFKDGFIHDFSHEFKTPISSINGFANLLLEGGLSDEERVQYLKIISDESERLSTLAENTLMLSRLENQQFVGEVKPYRLDLQIKECVILLEREWTAKDIDVVSDMAEVEFSGNAQLMQQVWLNLLNNAIKFTSPKGTITVSLREESGKVTACISDTGTGMSAEVAAHIFDKYYQGDSSRATSGNGLGLAIVKRIVTLSGGTVSVVSREGEGSTFTVEFAPAD